MTVGAGIAGRHAVVTGAGQGIGAEIAQVLATAGARLTLIGRNPASLESTAAALRRLGAQALVAAADVTDRQSLDAALTTARAKFDAVDILVNNAGQAQSAPIAKTDDALWGRMLAVNLTGTFYGIRAVLPEMIGRGFGRIVNVASTAGLKGYAYVAAYCAAKHGVVGLTRAAAREIAKHDITVNAVCPGYTDTPLLQNAAQKIQAATGRTADEAVAVLASANPQGRLIEPREVAHAVLWLCSPGSESITGQSIEISGGEVT